MKRRISSNSNRMQQLDSKLNNFVSNSQSQTRVFRDSNYNSEIEVGVSAFIPRNARGQSANLNHAQRFEMKDEVVHKITKSSMRHQTRVHASDYMLTSPQFYISPKTSMGQVTSGKNFNMTQNIQNYASTTAMSSVKNQPKYSFLHQGNIKHRRVMSASNTSNRKPLKANLQL